MDQERVSEEQMVKILCEAVAIRLATVAKKYGITDQTIYLWPRRYGVLGGIDVKRLTIRGSNAGVLQVAGR